MERQIDGQIDRGVEGWKNTSNNNVQMDGLMEGMKGSDRFIKRMN